MDEALDTLFARSAPVARALHDRLLAEARGFGEVRVEPKATCVHFCRGPAFAGVHPRKAGVMLTLRTTFEIDSPLVRKTERASANRVHNDLVLTALDEIDDDLISWLRSAWDLAAPKP